MSYNRSKQTSIRRTNQDSCEEIEDFVAIESPLEIRLTHDKKKFNTLVMTMCTPDDIDDLIYGYLFTEAIIKSPNHIMNIEVYDNHLGIGKIAEVLLTQEIKFADRLNNRQSVVQASCGVCGKSSFEKMLTYPYPNRAINNIVINSDVILALPDKLGAHQQAFTQTGGVHACALFDMKGQLIMAREDIGRHNALDKLIGALLQQSLLSHQSIILLSGRVSFELVHKSLMAGVSILCAIGAPSSLSIDIAAVNNMQLIGFIKKNRYNHYTTF